MIIKNNLLNYIPTDFVIEKNINPAKLSYSFLRIVLFTIVLLENYNIKLFILYCK